MKKRYTFECWNCKRKFSLFKDITSRQEWILPCPFCKQEVVVTLEPYRSIPIDVLKSNDNEAQILVEGYLLPKVIPTHKKLD